MLLDDEGDLGNVDLLDDTRRHIDGLHAVTAIRAEIDNVWDRLSNHLGREDGTFMFWVSSLGTLRAFALCVSLCFALRLDDVGRRRFGRSRGVLAGACQVFLETVDRGLQFPDLSLE
jgi:hypothetical protein